MIEQSDIYAIGKFQKTHALRGELNAIIDVDPDFLTEGHAIIIETDGIPVPFYASSVRPKGSTSYLVKLDGIETEDEARPFVNKTIYALKSELAPFLDMEEEDIVDEDSLSGYEILDSETGNVIGLIEDMDTSTDNPLFIVRTADGEEVFIPAVDDFVSDIDHDNRRISMRLPEGLIDLNSKK